MKVKAYCKMCGQPYMKTNGKSMFCSDVCKKARIKQRYEDEKEKRLDYQKAWRKKHGEEAKKRFNERHPNYYRDRSRSLRGSAEYTRQCEVCGNEFSTFFPQAKTCSDNCSRILRNRNRAKRIRSRYKLQAVFNAYDGICQICGKPCDWTDIKMVNGIKCMGDNYPTIDHIIPTSKGGEDAIDNIRLVHMICNAKKGA